MVMDQEALEVIRRGSYEFKLSFDTATELVTFDIPSRRQEPIVDAYNIQYRITDAGLFYHAKWQEKPTIIRCPLYACRTLMFIDVRVTCDNLKFNTNLLEFWKDSAKITEEQFFDLVWPTTIEFTDEIRIKEGHLKELVKRAYNAIIPFHEGFFFESKYLNVEYAYSLIKFIAFGGKVK